MCFRGGSLFLLDRKVLKNFRKDGHNWKKNGTKVLEGPERLKVGRFEELHFDYAHGEENESFQRRSYWMLKEELSHIALVHYLEEKGNRTDYNCNKGAEEPSCSRENEETIPSFQILLDAVYNNQAGLLMENMDAEFSDAVPFREDYQGKFSDVPGTDFSSLSQADKIKDINDAGLTWDEVLEDRPFGTESLSFHPSFSSTQTEELGSHLPTWDWQISENDSSLLSKWPTDQKLASDSAHNITSRSPEQDTENDCRTKLSNTDCERLLQSDPESNSTIQGKSLCSSSLKQPLFDGSLTEQDLTKTDSFNCWTRKELGDVKESHMQTCSGAYRETSENENEVEDSNISAVGNQLDIQQLFPQAQHRWLCPAEICEIVENYKKFRIASKPPNLPGSGLLFLFDRKVLKYFRKDGHNWKKKKNGTKVLEGHERLKVESTEVLHCYYAHGEENESFQRRSYWTIEKELSHIVLVHYREVKENRTDYSRNKVTEETPCSRENEETIRSFQIEGSTSSNFHPNNCHLPAQTTDDYQGNVPGTNFISLGQADKFKDINDDELTDDLRKNLAWQSWEDLLDACSSGIGSLPKPPSSNNFLLPSQTIDTTSLTSAQASEYEDAKSVYNNQASSRYDSSLDLQHPVMENIDAGFADPYYPIQFTNDYQGKSSDVPGTDFSSLSQADKIKDINDAGLTWEDVLENCSSGIGSLPFHPLFSSTQTDTIRDIPKQEHEILGQLFTKNWNLVERQELGSCSPARDWQISESDSSLLSKWPTDQKLASDSAHNITSRSPEQDIENDCRTELSNTDCVRLLQSDPESNSTIQGKSLFSSSLKQHLFDGSLTEEGLKKADSFNGWVSKELGDVKELHMQSSSGAYWETIENENEVEDSNISPSISQDQLYSIIDFSPNWAYVGSEIKVLITGRFLMSQQEAENNNWSCMFGEVEVPAEILAGGVLRCHTPAQKAGRVPFYVTCSNRLACSELQEFEYQENNVRDVDLADNSDSIKSESLHMRFGKLLCLSSIRTPNYDPSKPNEISELSGKISSLLEKDNDDHWDEMLRLTSEENFSVGKAKEKLLQKLLKEKLHVWLLQKVAEGGKGPRVLDQEGQGVLHFAAALGYDWALEPTVVAGVNINFRDVNGWTALHWAASCGRERTVASLISLGAAAGALSDPTPKYPSGQTPADLASAIGHKGIAGYLAESDLSSHISCIAINKKDDKASEPSGENPVQTVSLRSAAPITDENLRYGLSIKNSLAPVCKATQAAARIHQVFRVQSFPKKQLKEYGDDTFGMSDERALSLVAVESHKAGHHDEPVHAAAIRIQNKFRSWKGRKDFLTIRQQIVKIQAHVRGHQVRKNYKKVIWSVGILEKIILRWRRKGSGWRGFKSESLTENSSMIDTSTKEEDDYDFLKEGRKQIEERLQKALARVKSMIQYPEARDQYSRLLNFVSEIQETKATSLNKSGVSADFDDDLIDIDALLDDDTFMPTA